MYLDFTPEQDVAREELRRFLDDNLPSDWVGIWHGEEAAKASKRVTGALAERGWLTKHWPAKFGGQDGSVWDQAVVQEEMFAHHEPRGSQYMGVNWIGPTLMRFGTDEQQERYLPSIAAGDSLWAQLFSEPGAGSDLAALRTRADPTDDGFIVNGEKVWTSYANIAEHGFLLARTDPESIRHHGISAFLIDMKSPGIEVREIPSSVGSHRFHSVSFTDVKIPRDAVLGPVNDGWKVAMWALPFERAGNARYARTTRVLGLLERTTQGSDPLTRPALADALAFGRMTELLNYSAVSVVESGETPGWQASAAFASNALYEKEVAALAEEMLGFEVFAAQGDNAHFGGEIESFVACQAPTVMIQAGTYQIQLSIIAQQALNFGRSR